jgi:hypothetical protein
LAKASEETPIEKARTKATVSVDIRIDFHMGRVSKFNVGVIVGVRRAVR